MLVFDDRLEADSLGAMYDSKMHAWISFGYFIVEDPRWRGIGSYHSFIDRGAL